jgi:hypothetical protein
MVQNTDGQLRPIQTIIGCNTLIMNALRHTFNQLVLGSSPSPRICLLTADFAAVTRTGVCPMWVNVHESVHCIRFCAFRSHVFGVGGGGFTECQTVGQQSADNDAGYQMPSDQTFPQEGWQGERAKWGEFKLRLTIISQPPLVIATSLLGRKIILQDRYSVQLLLYPRVTTGLSLES